MRTLPNKMNLLCVEQETAHIVNSATERSLIVIDELGRSTSTAGKYSFCFSISCGRAHHPSSILTNASSRIICSA